mgnify:CR=1 FL=1
MLPISIVASISFNANVDVLRMGQNIVQVVFTRYIWMLWKKNARILLRKNFQKSLLTVKTKSV